MLDVANHSSVNVSDQLGQLCISKCSIFEGMAGDMTKFLDMHVERDGKSGSFTIDMERGLKITAESRADTPSTKVLTKNC